jgi:acetyl-CoA/propionyl-CoA carboxylase biotin carboxyl carrier protein
MADKIRAKATVAANGVRVVPGISGAGLDDAELAARATDLGFPLLVKPSAGGGGKGMRVVASSTELPEALAAARREARSAFGDDTLLLEQFVPRPRHVEVQILADVHGNIVHLGERECSLQRRHQKVIEEAPSPFLSDDQRDAIGAQAVAAARACGYTNAGTVEFIVAGDSGDDAYFLEMNTRLQVEHPVTEMVWGLDLVEQQLRIASGEPLGFSAADLRRHGHAIEARIYAEDPAHGFLPTGGTVRVLHEPDDLPGVRVDSSVLPGTVVGSTYDPMLSKIVAWGPDRDAARRRLDHALAQTCILGVTTNVAFQRTLLTDPDVVAGRLDTGLVERVAQTAPQTALPREVAIAAALVGRLPPTAVDDPWRDRGGWRLGPPAWSSWRATTSAGETVEVRLRAVDDAWEASVDGGSIARVGAQVDGDDLGLDVDGRVKGFCVGHDVSTTWVGAGGATWTFTEPEPAPPGSGMRRSGETVVTSPMPGTVVAVHAKVGERVAENEPVVVVEAMKMEHTLRAPCDAIVHEVRVGVSDLVALNQVLVVLEATDDDSRTK